MSTQSLEQVLTTPDGSSAPSLAAPPSPLWRRALPFGLAFALIAFTLTRIDLRTFVARLAMVNAPAFLAFNALFVVALLTADTLATVVVYRRDVAKIRFADFWCLRGASYLPGLLNHHVGQAFLTFSLARDYGVSFVRMAGATLLVYVSWGGCVLGIGCLSLLYRAYTADHMTHEVWQSLQWVAAVLVAGVSYLIVIGVRPARLARVKLLAPLFEAGVVGHLVALAVRLPHFVVLFLGTWLPFRFFGLDIPLQAALTYVPILMVVVTLPITPQGVGTRDLVAFTFFAAYAPGETADEKRAAIVAVTTCSVVAMALAEAAVGLLLLRRAMPASRRPAAIATAAVQEAR